MSTTTQRPTPKNERVEKALQYLVELAELVILMEGERDEARAIVSACMSAMPVGNIQTHTPENLAARIGDLASALAAETSENEAMREAIRVAWIEIQYAEASFAGLALRVCPNDSAVESVLNRMTEALAKLQPFIKP